MRVKYHADPNSEHIIGQLDEINLKDMDTSASRGNWLATESTAKELFPEYEPQISFKGGEIRRYGTKYSVRPDEYSEIYKNSIDAKNYNLETNRGVNSLGRNIVRQYNERIAGLPKGTKQTILVDVRGQDVKESALEKLNGYVNGKTNSNVEMLYLIK